MSQRIGSPTITVKRADLKPSRPLSSAQLLADAARASAAHRRANRLKPEPPLTLRQRRAARQQAPSG